MSKRRPRTSHTSGKSPEPRCLAAMNPRAPKTNERRPTPRTTNKRKGAGHIGPRSLVPGALLLFAAGNSCVCVHFPALPCQSHFKSVAFQASCQVQAASFAVFTGPCIFLVAQPPSVPTSLVLFYRARKLSAKREPAGFEPVGLEWGGKLPSYLRTNHPSRS